MSKENKKIVSKLFVRGKIHTLTGLHIGGNSGGLKIGGADGIVIRNTLNNEPYIPGSSLRGKMRSLLERVRGPENNKQEGSSEESKAGGYSSNGGAGTRADTMLGKLFGTSAGEKSSEPTRLIVRDAFLIPDSADDLSRASNTDMPMTEVKTEVDINRITSKPNAGPREIERVPAGATFKAEWILTLFDGDKPEQFLHLIFEALDLIQGDSLGGHGSRGYGKVGFKEVKITQKTIQSYKAGNKPEGEFKDFDVPEEFAKPLATLKKAG